MKIPKPKPRIKNRRMKEWNKIRGELKITFGSVGITRCELKYSGCLVNNFLSWCHKHKRSWYYGTNKLGDFSEIVLACVNCHNIFEKKKQEEKDLIFKKLR